MSTEVKITDGSCCCGVVPHPCCPDNLFITDSLCVSFINFSGVTNWCPAFPRKIRVDRTGTGSITDWVGYYCIESCNSTIGVHITCANDANGNAVASINITWNGLILWSGFSNNSGHVDFLLGCGPPHLTAGGGAYSDTFSTLGNVISFINTCCPGQSVIGFVQVNVVEITGTGSGTGDEHCPANVPCLGTGSGTGTGTGTGTEGCPPANCSGGSFCLTGTVNENSIAITLTDSGGGIYSGGPYSTPIGDVTATLDTSVCPPLLMISLDSPPSSFNGVFDAVYVGSTTFSCGADTFTFVSGDEGGPSWADLLSIITGDCDIGP